MRITIVLPVSLPCQHFAVASAGSNGSAGEPYAAFRQADGQQADELRELRELREGIRARQNDWLRLLADPAVWRDAKKRHAMLQARWDYQDAVINWISACRSWTRG